MADEAAATDRRLGEAILAGRRLRTALLHWCQLHQWDGPGSLIGEAQGAIEAWDEVDR